MITEEEKNIIKKYADEFKVKEVYLFGSSLNDSATARDIDLAVKGIAPSLFFRFYGKLIKYLPKPVDLVDLDDDSPSANLIMKEAVKVYG